MDQQIQSENGNLPEGQVTEVITDSIEELKKQLNHEKSIKAGETRKNSELLKQVREQELQIQELQDSYEKKLTDSEKLQYEDQKKANELKKLSDEVALLRKENQNRELHDLKLKILRDNDLQDFDLIDLLGGESIEMFSKNVASYIERQNKIAEKIKMGLVNGKAPAEGSKEAGSNEITRSDFNKCSPIEKRNLMRKGAKIID
jgi:hypothetical protein